MRTLDWINTDRRERGLRHLPSVDDTIENMWVQSFRKAASEPAKSVNGVTNGATPARTNAPARPPPGLGHVNLSQEALERWERVQREMPAAAARIHVPSRRADRPDSSQQGQVRVELGSGGLVPEHRIPPLQLDGSVSASVPDSTPPPRTPRPIPRSLHSSRYTPRNRLPLVAYPTAHHPSPPK